MATSAQVSMFYEAEGGGSVLLDPTTSPSNRISLFRSATLQFVNQHSSSGSAFGFRADQWSTTFLSSIPGGFATTSISVLSNAPFGDDDITINLGGKSTTLHVKIITSVDDTPDPFSIGPPVVSAELNTYYEFPPFLIKGINSIVNINPQGCEFRFPNFPNSNYQSFPSSMENNNLVQVRALSNNAFGSNKQISIQIGSVTSFTNIITRNNPLIDPGGTRIPFPFAENNISLKKVTEFFACPLTSFGNPPRIGSAYRRGGNHVPPISENSGIADTNQANDLLLSSFDGSATTFYFKLYPQGKFDSANTVGGAQSLSVQWVANQDWNLGYSTLMAFNAEYRYVLQQSTEGTAQLGATLTTNTGLDPGTYNRNNINFTVSASSGQNTEKQFKGIVKLYARSLLDGTTVLIADVPYDLFFYGP